VTVKSKVVVATKVSVAEKLSAARLVKSAEVVEVKSKKATLALVAKAGGKVPATKISRSEPTSPGSKVINGKFAFEASAAPVLAAKVGGDSAVQSTSSVSAINFKVGDKIVYPGHGVGEIEGIRTTVLSGQEHHIYNIKILDSGMKVMVPVSQASAVGLRKIIDKKAIDEVFSILKDRDFKIDTQTWNRRFREYSQKIKTGSVFEIAVVLRDLSVLSADKELSFGEKKMLDMAETLLVSEIAIAKARPHDKVVGELRALFA
jgi:CarD family transcriptional regulator